MSDQVEALTAEEIEQWRAYLVGVRARHTALPADVAMERFIATIDKLTSKCQDSEEEAEAFLRACLPICGHTWDEWQKAKLMRVFKECRASDKATIESMQRELARKDEALRFGWGVLRRFRSYYITDHRLGSGISAQENQEIKDADAALVAMDAALAPQGEEER